MAFFCGLKVLEKKQRLAKRIAESGIASRREAERLIEAGKVSVDGTIITTPVCFVDPTMVVAVDGVEISHKSEQIMIWKFYKPREVITTKYDAQNRKTVFDFFDVQKQRLLYIGRLDYNSEGLLLFTNNGDLARKMELPSTALPRTYCVRIFGNLSNDAICKLKEGITIEGIRYGSIDVRADTAFEQGANTWITVILYEGKNREIRKVMEYFGCTVSRLIRTSYGPFKLDKMKLGEIAAVDKKHVENFLEFLRQK